MTPDEKRRDLVSYRLSQAREPLDEAEYLLAGGKSLRGVVNRAYYAMFYAVLALLVGEPYSSSKHAGVLSYFNRRFIRGGIFPEDMGFTINRAFEMRQRGNYKEHVVLDQDEVSQVVHRAKEFVEKVEKYMSDM